MRALAAGRLGRSGGTIPVGVLTIMVGGVTLKDTPLVMCAGAAHFPLLSRCLHATTDPEMRCPRRCSVISVALTLGWSRK